ncbi:MAG: nucleoside triphosphate pyrophosphohydrolase [Acidimicrobiales bacterium]
MSGRVVVVGLGPAGPGLMTDSARQVLARAGGAGGAGRLYVRTRRHPGAAALARAESFDDLYESASTREEVYAGIAEALVDAATRCGEVVYAVPGSPLVLERSVALLRAGGRVEVELVAGLSFLDLAWARLGVDPVAAGVRLVDGEAFAVQAAGERGPLLVAHCWAPHVLSAVKLAVEDEPDEPVTVLARLGLDDEAVFQVAWAELDRAFVPDHLTSLYVPSLTAPVGVELARLGELVRTLRQRCPWDAEQSHSSLTRHLVEETYEVLDAIEALDVAAGTGYDDLEEELGDLLFHVFFHATLASEEGQFNLSDVARRVHEKLVGRHPHVFGSVVGDSSERVVANWERIKRAEKGRASVMDGIPASLPALLTAAKVVAKAAAAGADRGSAGEAAAALEGATRRLLSEAGRGQGPDAEAAEMGRAEMVGVALLCTVDLARHLGVDPEAALRRATATYRERFVAVEERAGGQGVDLAEPGPDG